MPCGSGKRGVPPPTVAQHTPGKQRHQGRFHTSPPRGGANIAAQPTPGSRENARETGALGAVLRVQRGLLLSRRERPGRTGAPVAAKDEAELLRRPQPVGMIWAERRTRFRLGQRTEQVPSEEAVLAPRCTGSVARHGKWVLSNIDPATAWIKSGPVDRHNRRSRNTREKHPLHHEIPAYRPDYFAIDVSLQSKII